MKKQPPPEPSTGSGLLASGFSGKWEVSIDVSLAEEGKWEMQMEGSSFYLTFRLRDLAVVPKAIAFLGKLNLLEGRAGPAWAGRAEEQLTLGHFGRTTVSLILDNEDFVRCFLVVGPTGSACMRFSLGEADLKMLHEALQQVNQDLPPIDHTVASKNASAVPEK